MVRPSISAAAAVLTACAMAWADGPPDRPSAEDVARGLAGPEGWAVADLHVYGPDNVYEKIDGQDQAYLAFDLVAMANVLFEKDKDGLDVEVYDMGKPEHALGIFAQQHRAPNTQYETIEGGEAAVFPARIFAWKGPFYVRIDRRRKAAEDEDGLVRRLAHSLLRAIPGRADGAGLVAPLPKQGMRPHSAGFTHKDYLGYECLSDVRQAKYGPSDRPVTLFLLRPADAVVAMLAVRQGEKSIEDVPGLGDEAFRAKRPYFGTICVVRLGKFIVGSVDPEGTAGAPEALRETLRMLGQRR